MSNIVSVFDLEVTIDPAKEFVRKIAQNLEDERIYTVDFVTLEPLLQEKDNEEWKKQMKSMDLLIPGGGSVLGTEKTMDKTLGREIENRVFPKLLLRFLQKNKKTIYLLAESEEALIVFEKGLRVYGQNIRIIGRSVLQDNKLEKDYIINDINGLEPDCIFSALPSPMQEEFIYENKTLLNARVWVGCGKKFIEEKKNIRIKNRVRLFILKKIFHYQLERQTNEDEK